MRATKNLGLFISFLLLPTIALCQVGLENKVVFKSGIYLTMEEFLENKPSLPFEGVNNLSAESLENRLCERKIEYIEDNQIKTIKTQEIWGICINGQPYIRHTQLDETFGVLALSCFYKLFNFGTLTRYFVMHARTRMINFLRI